MRSLAETIGQVRADGRSRDVRCPAHDDRTASLSVGRGDEGRILLHCHAGCSLGDILTTAGLDPRDLFDAAAAPKVNGQRREIVASYPYRDEAGALLYEVVRLAPKSFRQRRPDGAGGWIWRLDDVRRVVYRLDRLATQRPAAVFVVEGEKDVEALEALKLPATCNPAGAGKWTDDYTAQLVACGVQRVAILPDHDRPGQEHAETVARACHAAGLEVRVVTLPGLPEKGDVADFLAAGGSRADLVTITKQTPVWTPATDHGDGLQLTSLAALLAESEQDEIEWLVDQRFRVGSFNLLAGKPKAGKSTLARQLALCVARGEPWLTFGCRRGPAWYLAFEDHRSDVRRAFRRLGASPTDDVHLFIGPPTPDLFARLSARAQSAPPALLVLDTLFRATRVKDVANYAEVLDQLAPVLALARATSAVIVAVVHAKKGDVAGLDSVLGSQALVGTADNILIVDRSERGRFLESIQRVGPDLDKRRLDFDEDTGEVALGGTKQDVDLDAVLQGLYTELRDAGSEHTETAALALVEGRLGLKRVALRRLVDRGAVTRRGNGKRGDPYLYQACPDSRFSFLVPPKGGERAFRFSQPHVEPVVSGVDSRSSFPRASSFPKPTTEVPGERFD